MSARSFELAQSRPAIKPLGWLLQFISEYYRAKRDYDQSTMSATSDQELKKQRQLGGIPVQRKVPFSSPLQFFFIHLKHVFGSNELVTENIRNLLATARAFMNLDLRVMLFLRCVFSYDLDIACFSMQLSLALEQCSTGLTYHVSRGVVQSPPPLCLDCFPLCRGVRKPSARVQCLMFAGLRKRPYAPVLAVDAHARRACALVEDDASFITPGGGVQEAIMQQRRARPSSWSDDTYALNRTVVHRASLIAIATYWKQRMRRSCAPAAMAVTSPQKSPSPLQITDKVNDIKNRSENEELMVYSQQGGARNGLVDSSGDSLISFFFPDVNF